MDITIAILTHNDSPSILMIIKKVKSLHQNYELLVVDDASTDETLSIVKNSEVKVYQNPMKQGMGAAFKTAVQVAKNDIIVIFRGDYQYAPQDINNCIKYIKNHDVIIGSRDLSQASLARYITRTIQNKLASWLYNYEIEDLTSEFMIINKKKVSGIVSLLTNNSVHSLFLTTSFINSKTSLKYISIRERCRLGKGRVTVLKQIKKFTFTIFELLKLYIKKHENYVK